MTEKELKKRCDSCLVEDCVISMDGTCAYDRKNMKTEPAEVEYYYEKVNPSYQGHVLDNFGGWDKEWQQGEGLFLEKCKCHPERDGKLVAIVKEKEGYALYSSVE